VLDVVLFCEGTYPFIAGGVSSWIHALISAMPELKFGIVFLSPGRSFKKELKYQLPPNLIEFVEVYIYDVRMVQQNPLRTPEQEEAAWAALENFSAGIIDGRWGEINDLFKGLGYPPRLSLEEMPFPTAPGTFFCASIIAALRIFPLSTFSGPGVSSTSRCSSCSTLPFLKLAFTIR